MGVEPPTPPPLATALIIVIISFISSTVFSHFPLFYGFLMTYHELNPLVATLSNRATDHHRAIQ